MGRVWAIARNTLLMAMRRRTPLVAVFLLMLGIPLLSPFLEGDNTLVGLLRLVTTYYFTLMSGLLMALMLYLGATVLDEELRRRMLWLVDAKPVARWQVLVGKWLGLALLAAWLLAVMGALLYVVLIVFATPSLRHPGVPAAVVRWLGGFLVVCLAGMLLTSTLWKRPRLRRVLGGLAVPAALLWTVAGVVSFIHHYAVMKPRDPAQVLEAHRQFLVSRRSFRPRLPDVEEEIAAARARLEAAGQLDEAHWDPAAVRLKILEVLDRNRMPIPFGAGRTFHFDDLPPRGRLANEELTVRYRLYGRRGEASVGWMQHIWRLRPPAGGVGAEVPQESRSGKTREFRAPVVAVSDAGRMELDLINVSEPNAPDAPPATLSVPLDDGIEVLLATGSFEANFVRALLLLWIRLAMLAALGIALNAFVGGPVTAFFLFGVIVTGLLNAFVVSVLAPPATSYRLHRETGLRVEAKRTVARVLRLLPDFEETSPVGDLHVGREITWRRLAGQAGRDLLLRAGLVALVGWLLFRRREIALPLTT